MAVKWSSQQRDHAARGCVHGCLVALAFWIIVAATLTLVGYNEVKNLVDPPAASASVVSMRKIDHRARVDSWNGCYAEESYLRRRYGNVLPRCEGIDPPYCRRRSLARPNNVICGLGYFLSYGKRHRDCMQGIEYRVTATGSIRVPYRGPRSCVWDYQT